MTFTAKIERMNDDGGWYIVRIPSETVQKLRAAAHKKGNIPVLCHIGKSEWSSTIMSMGEQQWFVAVKAAIRQAERIDEGDNIVIDIRPDATRLPA